MCSSLLVIVFLSSKFQENEFTIYPYVLDTCNNWTYEDQIRPVQFPDLCPATASSTVGALCVVLHKI